jgi:hypothetical protein
VYTAPNYYVLVISLRRSAEIYRVELSHTDPRSQAEVASTHGTASFELTDLTSRQATPDDYGKALAQQLFVTPSVRERFVQVETAAHATNSFLRVVLKIDPSAQELQMLRWELLTHPNTGSLLSTSERVLLSRFVVSSDWQPVQLRARSELRALVAVSAPAAGKLRQLDLAEIDFDAEATRARQSMVPLKTQTLGGPQSPLTLNVLVTELRKGIDILYLVCHGTIGRRSGTPALILQDDAGEARAVPSEDIAIALGELQRKPRLVVLASCESAGDGTTASNPAHVSLASRLSDQGVPAVLAMQGRISMATVEHMMPVFFSELHVDGQIDRALAVARARVRERLDAWMPALFMRLTTGCLWYTAGFRTESSHEIWHRLLSPVANGKVVPIIGPRLMEAAYGDVHDTALHLAGRTHYPLAPHDRDDLPRVTSYLSIKESRYNVIQAYHEQLLTDLLAQHSEWLPANEVPPAVPKPKLGHLLALVGDRLRARKTDAHRILAELPASVYVTTNFDPLLERALKAADRAPQRVVSRWRYGKAPVGSKDAPVTEPTAKAPLVYHIFGAFDGHGDESLVLTEDDYFDFLIAAAGEKLIPTEVESSLVDNSLLFLGFRLTDWHFRVFFRLLMSFPGKDRLKHYRHVAVQLEPDMYTMADVDGAKAYLAEYFGKEANIDVFWGSTEDFLAELRAALASHDIDVQPSRSQGDDEWDF